MRLQDDGFRDGQVAPPTRNWVCGRATEETACSNGPDEKGRCRVTMECVPVWEGARWHCSRISDGPCEDGPLPDGACCRSVPACQPIPSLLAVRRRITFWLSMVMVGLSLLFLSGPKGSAFFSPGELTFGHGASVEACADCHAAAHGDLVDRVFALGVSGTGQENSKLCLTCHHLGDHALEVHGRFPKELAVVTEGLSRMPQAADVPLFQDFSSWVLGLLETGEKQLACATCHGEHRGKNFNLLAMNAQQCQTCHARTFSDFANNHPPFSGYPYERRTRIAFDHTSHIGKHFFGEFKKDAPITCAACHRADAAGQTMRTGTFENICASCHAEQIEGVGRSGAKGFAFLRLPGLDLETLQEHGVSVGEWPADANFEDGLTPFMELLLGTDSAFAEDLAFLSGLDDFTDLSDATDKEIAAVGRIVWAVKRLVYNLVMRGQQEIVNRLQMTTNIGARKFADLFGQFPVEVIYAAQQNWLPHLAMELSGLEAGEAVVQLEDRDAEQEIRMDRERERKMMIGGWYRQDSEFAILYRPIGHADPFLYAWLDFTVQATGVKHGRSAETIFTTLANPKAPGLCMKCHSVDAQAGQRKRIHWAAARPVADERKATRFTHAVHFSLLDDKGCLTCHTLNPEAEVMEAFEHTDPLTFSSNFRAMEKTVCTTCHTSKRAGDTCLTCHNYHVGTMAPVLPNAPLTAPSPSTKRTTLIR